MAQLSSVEGLVQQIVLLFGRGYLFYVQGRLPEGADPAAVDAKIAERYQVARSKFAKYRAAKAGAAKTSYLRLEHDYFLLSTHGKSPFFESENFRDARRCPLKFAGYSISYRGKHTNVCIEKEQFYELRRLFRAYAAGRTVEQLSEALSALPFEPYAGVRKQLFQILAAVNKERRQWGLAPVPWQCLRLRRRSVKVY